MIRPFASSFGFSSPSLLFFGWFSLGPASWILRRLSSGLWRGCCFSFRAVRCSLEAVGCISASLRVLVWIAWSLECFGTVGQRDCTMLPISRIFRSSLRVFHCHPNRFGRSSCSVIRHNDGTTTHIAPKVHGIDAPKPFQLLLWSHSHLKPSDCVLRYLAFPAKSTRFHS